MVLAQHQNELILVWKHPMTRQRFVIGRLWCDAEGYYFRYEQHVERGINEALERGFRLLDAFPDLNRTYHSDRLFATFSKRMPPRWRHEGLEKMGVDPRNPMDYFARIGGRLATDTMEFLPPITTMNSQNSGYRVEFPVAGWRYYLGESMVARLAVGDPVHLEIEDDSLFDINAIKVLVGPEHTLVGYVPAIYSWHLDESVAFGNYRAVIHRIGSSKDPQQRLWLAVSGELTIGPRGDLTGTLRDQYELLNQ